MTLRPLLPDDADELHRLLVRNREHLRPWEPARDDEYFTLQATQERLHAAEREREADRHYSWAITFGSRFVGVLTLSSVIRGALQSASLGYWVDVEHQGRGIATAAVGDACGLAFGDLDLHRIQAEVLPHNLGSRRVLDRCGFVHYGHAPDYLRIDGRWQSFDLLQRIAT